MANDGKLALVYSVVVLAASLTLNVVLLTRHSLKEPEASIPPRFEVGATLMSLVGTKPDGTTTTPAFDRDTVLYVFSPTCPWCERDYQNLMTIHSAAQDRFEFLGVALNNSTAPKSYADRLASYLKRHPFPGEIIFVDPEKLPHDLRGAISLTPQTLVISAGGRIKRAWAGAFMNERLADAQTFFGVRLPGPQLSKSSKEPS
jgi:hypothetical protein